MADLDFNTTVTLLFVLVIITLRGIICYMERPSRAKLSSSPLVDKTGYLLKAGQRCTKGVELGQIQSRGLDLWFVLDAQRGAYEERITEAVSATIEVDQRYSATVARFNARGGIKEEG